MSNYLFIADDNEISNLEGFRVTALEAGFVEVKDFAHLNFARRRELLAEAESLSQEGNNVFLVTDAHFGFEAVPKLGGDKLAREFLKGRNRECRAVIQSE